LNEASEHLLDFHNGNILFKDNQLWTISKNKYTFICKTHGEFQATFQDVVRIRAGIKAKGCSVCAKESRLVHLNQPVDNYLEKILSEKSYGIEYQWLSNYTGDNKELHEIKHTICDTTIKMRPNDFQQGKICKCSTIVYLYRLKYNDESFIKVGVRTANRSYSRDGLIIDEILIERLFDRNNALELEKTVISEFKNFAYTPGTRFDGEYECFSNNASDLIKDKIKNFK
jgi:hypothetical protein